MPRNTKTKRTNNRRPNLPEETLERARAELRGETFSAADLPAAPQIGSPAGTRPAPSKAATAAKAKRAASSLATRRIPPLEELLADYRYVTHDLRNLAILAGLLLVAIFVVSLLLSSVS